jgi:hypothetical protein
MESVLDRERKCDRCKTKPATCIFDRMQVCAGCYLELDEALLQEARPTENGAMKSKILRCAPQLGLVERGGAAPCNVRHSKGTVKGGLNVERKQPGRARHAGGEGDRN